MSHSGRLAGLVCAVLGLFALAYFGSPYLAVHNLSEAAKAGDRDRLEEMVDFPAVRSSLKSQVSAYMLKAMRDDPDMRNNPFAGLGMLLAPTIIDRAVDAYVTPDAISMMVTTGSRPGRGRGDAEGQSGEPRRLQVSYAFISPDRFRVDLRRPDDREGKPLGLVLERRGLLTWRLIRIDLSLGQAMAPAGGV